MGKDKTELTVLNAELMSFDLDNVTAEELEHRLELAIATMPTPSFFCDVDCSACTSNNCCKNTKEAT
jgi:hypothetical protein